MEVDVAGQNLLGTWIEKRMMVQEQYAQAALGWARATTKHPTRVGDSAELAIREAFRAHLPTSFRVGHGTVHDSLGTESKQVDVVITNPDHPFNSPDPERSDDFFIEGVSAVAEVKATLRASSLKSAIEAGTEFKKLAPKYNKQDRILSDEAYTRHTNGLPPFVLIAFDTNMSEKTLLRTLYEASDVPSAIPGGAPQPPIDAVCVLGKYALWPVREVANPMFKVNIPTQPDRRAWSSMPTAAPFSWVLVWLQLSMPRIERTKPVLAHYLTSRCE